MNRATLLALALLFALLGGVAWWQLERERSGAFVVEVPLFEDLSREEVQAFVIDNLERTVQVRFESRGGEWWIVDPLETRADRGVIERLLEIVEHHQGLVVPAGEADPRALGFEPPRVVLDVIALRGGRELRQRVELGRRDLGERGVYARVRGRIVRTLASLDTQLDKNVEDYRSRRVLELAAESVVEVHRVGRFQPALEAEPIDQTLSALREGASWRLMRPYEALLDPLAVVVLVAGATRLHVERFVEDLPPDLARYGLDQPQVSIEVVDSLGRRNTLHLARRGFEGDWFATREDRRAVWTLAQEDTAPLFLPVETMFDSLILRLAREEIDGLRLESPERDLRLARGPRGWTVSARVAGEASFGPPRAADARRVEALLARLEGAELEAFLPGLPFPEDAPRLAVWVEARGHTFGGRLGPEAPDLQGRPARLFQRHGDEVLALVGTWCEDLARTPLETLLDPRLVTIEEIHLSALRLEGPAGRLRFVRDERGHWRREGTQAEALDLLPLLDPLLFLRAAEHLEAPAAAALEQPLTVVFERTDGGEEFYTLGLGAGPDGAPRAEALVGDVRAVLRERDLHRRLRALLP